ncbi:hypothetical protein ACFE04_007328 [Oxalis oulophora]
MDMNDQTSLRREIGDFLEQNVYMEEIKSMINHKRPTEIARNIDPKYLKEGELVLVRFEGPFVSRRVTPRELLSEFIGSMVCVEGIITKCSLVRPKVVKSVHYCSVTKKFTSREYRDITSNVGLPTGSEEEAIRRGASQDVSRGFNTLIDANDLDSIKQLQHLMLYTSIHAKPKPKFKSGAITESTTALNVDQTNGYVVNADQKSAAMLPLVAPSRAGNSQDQQSGAAAPLSESGANCSIEACIMSLLMPRSQIDIFVQVLQANANLNYAEDSDGGPDVIVGILPKLNKETLLQPEKKVILGEGRHLIGLKIKVWWPQDGHEAPNMGSPRLADCADLLCQSITNNNNNDSLRRSLSYNGINCQVHHKVSDSDNRLSTGDNFPSLDFKSYKDPDLFASS